MQGADWLYLVMSNFRYVTTSFEKLMEFLLGDLKFIWLHFYDHFHDSLEDSVLADWNLGRMKNFLCIGALIGWRTCWMSRLMCSVCVCFLCYAHLVLLVLFSFVFLGMDGGLWVANQIVFFIVWLKNSFFLFYYSWLYLLKV